MKPERLIASELGIHSKQLNGPALETLERLQKAGYEAYIVGGFVRDLLSGWTPKDFDIATSATPEEVVALLPRSQLIGRRFKLVHAHYGRGRDRHTIEIATFRSSEQSLTRKLSDSGQLLRDNEYGSIEEDAWRRDFTVNALYYDPARDLLLDFVGGLDDIRHRRLRIIGDPDTRFTEDPVRVLRAIRFAAKLGWRIEPATEKAMLRQQHLLAESSAARLFDEVLKLFLTEYGWECWLGVERHGIDDTLFPQSAALLGSEPAHTFLHRATASTAERIRDDKPVNPAFIYAVLLWPAVLEATLQRINEGVPAMAALQQSGSLVIERQQHRITIPRRFALVIREIWALQLGLAQRRSNRIDTVLAHPRFRAAYDFLGMRVSAGDTALDATEETFAWWTQIQNADASERTTLMQELPASRGRPRRRRNPRKRRANGG